MDFMLGLPNSGDYAQNEPADARGGVERLIQRSSPPDRYRIGNRSDGTLGVISISATGEYDLTLLMPSMMAATFLTIWIRLDSARGCELVLTGGPRKASSVEHAD